MTSPMEPRTPRDTRPLLVGFDGSPASLVALDRALLMARALDAPLRLVAAWQMPVQYSGFGIVDWSPEEFARTVVDDAVRDRFGADVPAWFTTELHQGGAASVLIRLSRDAQMLVVGSRGHGGFAGLLLGSVSSACAEHARCPVLVMHEETAGAPIPAPTRVAAGVA